MSSAALDALNSRLRDRRGALARLEREREILITEIRAYEDAARLIANDRASEPGATTDKNAFALHRPPARVTGGERGKSLSQQWKTILGWMAKEYPLEFSYDDLGLIAEIEGIELNRNTARSQMGMYANEGIVERVAEGRFRITEVGAQLADAQLGRKEGSDVAPPEPSLFFPETSVEITGASPDAIFASLQTPTNRDLLSSAVVPSWLITPPTKEGG